MAVNNLLTSGFSPGCMFRINRPIRFDDTQFDRGTVFKASHVTEDVVSSLARANGRTRQFAFSAGLVELLQPSEVLPPKRVPAVETYFSDHTAWAAPADDPASVPLTSSLCKAASAINQLKSQPDNFTLYISALFWLLTGAFQAGFTFMDIRKGLARFLQDFKERKESPADASEVPETAHMNVLSPMFTVPWSEPTLQDGQSLTFKLPVTETNGMLATNTTDPAYPDLSGRIRFSGGCIFIHIDGYGSTSELIGRMADQGDAVVALHGYANGRGGGARQTIARLLYCDGRYASGIGFENLRIRRT